MTMNYDYCYGKCDKYESNEVLLGLAPFWQIVEDATSCSPIQHFIWNSACSAALPTPAGIAVHVIRTGPRTGAIAPLANSERTVGSMESLGLKDLYEPSDFLYSDRTALRALAMAIAEAGTQIYLGRVPADSPTIAAIKEAYQGRGLVFVRGAEPYPRIRLDKSWCEPLQHLNAGRGSDLRRALRRAEKLGAVTFEFLSPTLHELPALLDEAFEVEAANWKGRTGSALTLDAVRGRFFRHYAAFASTAGTLRLCFLRIGGRAAAMQLAVECKGSFWLFKIGYREEFANCSPGMLLIAETIRYSAGKGLSGYEFLGTTEEWTRVWTKEEQPCVSIRVYPLRPLGVKALAVDAMHFAGRRLQRAMLA
jgi:CelD/BcsL family acetyltransferase involved in cellulose biosynthesis